MSDQMHVEQSAAPRKRRQEYTGLDVQRLMQDARHALEHHKIYYEVADVIFRKDKGAIPYVVVLRPDNSLAADCVRRIFKEYAVQRPGSALAECKPSIFFKDLFGGHNYG